MVSTRARRRIDLQPDRVWSHVGDHEGMSSWLPGLNVTIEREGREERNGVGTVRRFSALGPDIREEVTAFEPGRRLAYRALSGIPLPDYRGEVRIAPSAAGSTVTWELTTSATSRLVRIPLWVLSNLLISALARATREKRKDPSTS